MDSERRPILAILTALLAALCCSSSALAAIPVDNLVKNPGAEAEVESNGDADIDVDEFEPETGKFTAIRYGTGNYPSVAVSDGYGGQQLFFAGGDAAQSSGQQVVDLTPSADEIDMNVVDFKLEARLGGYAAQADAALLRVTFLSGNGAPLKDGQIGPVTATDRDNKTGLLQRTLTGRIPAGTRSARLSLEIERRSGTANDGYADNLSLTLSRSDGSPPPQDPDPPPGSNPPKDPPPEYDEGGDADRDAIEDPNDNCVEIPNRDQADLDVDGYGDACDGDLDGDRVLNTNDRCATVTAYTITGCPRDTPQSASVEPTLKIVDDVDLSGGGRGLVVVANVPCDISASSSVLTKIKGARVTISGFNATTLVPFERTMVPVRPIPSLKGKKEVSVPAIDVKTTITCRPIVGMSDEGFGVPADPLALLKGTKRKTVTRTLRLDPPEPPGRAHKLVEAGEWSGKIRNSPGGLGVVTFEASASGKIFNFKAYLPETCTAPGGAGQQAGVRSLPRYAVLKIDPLEGIRTSPKTSLPKLGTYRYKNPNRAGTQLIDATSRGGFVFTNERTAHGSLEAVRRPIVGVKGTRCTTSISWEARPSGAAKDITDFAEYKEEA